MSEILTNRTYQIIAGVALLAILVLLYTTSSTSEDVAAATPITNVTNTQGNNKVETTTVANDNVSEDSEKIEVSK